MLARMKTTYRHAGIGGTFDHFHTGHELLIKTAFQKADYVSIGITTDAMTKEKEFVNSIQSYHEREQQVASYVNKLNASARANIFPLTDKYGTAITDQTIDTIIVSAETRATALRINEIRISIGMSPCQIFTIPFVKGSNRRIVRSCEIRRGKIDRIGNQYRGLLLGKTNLRLPKSLRNELREPLGIIIPGTEDEISDTGKKAMHFLNAIHPVITITVGDIATKSLQETGYKPDVAVIDFKTQRAQVSKKKQIPTKGYVLNPAGTLCKKAMFALDRYIQLYFDKGKTECMIVRGEEDLLTLPAILFAPLGSAVIYGQYGVGLVVVQVDEEMKQKVKEIIAQFE